MEKSIILLGVILIGVFFLNSSTYVITPDYQVVITQFGKPVGEPINKSGLHFKKPLFKKLEKWIEEF